MPLQLIRCLRKLSKFMLVAFLVSASSSWVSAAEGAPSAGCGSLDDWLALGLAMLAALYCVQKRE